MFKVFNIGSGRMQSTKSETMQNAALKNHHISNLIHLPPGMLLFQKYRTGVQARMDTSNVTRPYVAKKAMRNQAVIRYFRSLKKLRN
jgi:hypothetical protein